MTARPWFTRPAPSAGRRLFVATTLASIGAAIAPAAAAQDRKPVVVLANLTEEPGVRIEGLGFTGADVRNGFQLAARRYPIDLRLLDNGHDKAKALANVEAAIRDKAALYIGYFDDPATNAEIARRLKGAGIPAIAIGQAIGDAPIYGADNTGAGRIAGEALGRFAATMWSGLPAAYAIVGPVSDPAERIKERIAGILGGLNQAGVATSVARLDTGGNPQQTEAVLGRFLSGQSGRKILLATLDDSTALSTKAALEAAGRLNDTAIVSLGCDRSVHGGMNDKKEIDPANRASVLIGSVGFYLDRYGYDVLPMAMKLLRGEALPPRTATTHRLITSANIFMEYPPADMN